MPTYQYACTECGHRFEAVQSFTDAALTDCPQCTGRLRKVFNSVGIVFKGSGFYRTDSRSSSNGQSSDKADTKADTKAGTKAGTSSGTGSPKETASSSASTSSTSSTSAA